MCLITSMEEKFYREGLRFSCARCSSCCRHDPGFVFLSLKDIETLIAFLRLSKHDFIMRYVKEVDMGDYRRLSLIEKPNYDCIFWDEGGCSVYEARPLQCRSYPFWHHHLLSKDTWDALADSCPGINNGSLHTEEEIEGWLRQRSVNPLIRMPARIKP